VPTKVNIQGINELDFVVATGSVTATTANGVTTLTFPADITLKTNGTNNGSQAILNLKNGGNITITDDGVGGVTITSNIAFQTNSTPNGSQSLLNLANGAGITITDNGSGTITIASNAAGTQIVKKTTTYTAALGDIILCDTSVGGFTINLPLASASNNGKITIKKITSDANVVTVTRAGSDLIDGDTTKTIILQYVSMSIVGFAADNAWYIY
jgi:hypothetical protein